MEELLKRIERLEETVVAQNREIRYLKGGLAKTLVNIDEKLDLIAESQEKTRREASVKAYSNEQRRIAE